MHPNFAEIVESFELKLKLLLQADGCTPLEVSKAAPKAGVYVLFEDEKPL